MKASGSSLKSMLITIIVMTIIAGLLVVSIPSPTFSEPINASEVWVNDDWVVNATGDIVDGHTFGTDAFATIGDGVYNVESGGIVHVYAGTYNEGVAINKPLVLNGNRAGVPGGNAFRGPDESIINGSNVDGTAISVTNGGVVIDGFEIAVIPGASMGIKAEASNDLAVKNTRVFRGTDTAISVGGSSATIIDNYINVPVIINGSAINVTGYQATVSGNEITVIGFNISAISVEGSNPAVNGNIIGNEESIYDYGILCYGDNGVVTDNSFDGYVNIDTIHVEGENNTIHGNQAVNGTTGIRSPAIGIHSFINAASTGSGHAVITDNVGGRIEHIGDNGMITNNVVDLPQYGVLSAGIYIPPGMPWGINSTGDHTVISDNSINGWIGGINVSGYDCAIERNKLNIGIAMDSDVGIFNNGDENLIADNVLNNTLMGIVSYTPDTELLIFEGFSGEATAMMTNAQTPDSIKGDISSKLLSLDQPEASANDFLVNSIHQGGSYSGYANVIRNNTVNNLDEVSYYGIYADGIDTVISSNTVNTTDEGLYFMGIASLGSGGTISDNTVRNAEIGLYCGGYFVQVPYSNVVIEDNTMDNTMVGIMFEGDGLVDNNTVTGSSTTMIGAIVWMTGGAVTNNDVEGAAYAGIAGQYDNVEVAGNRIEGYAYAGMYVGTKDPLSTPGNVYLHDNVLMSSGPCLAQLVIENQTRIRFGDGSVTGLDEGSLVGLLDTNSLNTAAYVVDKEGKLVEMPISVMSEFSPSVVVVWSDPSYLAFYSLLLENMTTNGSTAHVRPGVYNLSFPIYIIQNELNFLGNPAAPDLVTIDTAHMVGSILPLGGSSAFSVYANNVTIAGFRIMNSSNTGLVNGSIENYGIEVGYNGTELGLPPEFFSGSMPGNCTFVNNTILNMSAGIYLDACRNITIEHNQLKGNAVGVNITALCDPSSVEIHNNDISGNTEYGVNNNYGELRSPLLGAAAIPGPEWVNATYNWWGNTSGPHNLSDPGSTSTGDNVTMYVYYEPWLTKPMYSSTYTYHLVAGWNLVSIPLDVADSSIEGFFPESVGSSIVDIWGWNESTQNWVFYCHDPDSIYYDYYPALTELETGRAYWVDIPVEASFEVQGAVPDGAPQSPVPLVSSWNFIGPTGLSPQTPAGLYQSAVDVWGWDESAQNWIFYCPDPDNMYYDYYPGLTQVQPGHGYWVDMP